MAFTVEDGTGIAAANAYIDVAYADAYFTDRLITEWAGEAGVKQSAIIRATDYIETTFGSQFVGCVEFPDVPQGLSFPRLWIYDRSGMSVRGIPEKIKKATAEYALRALTIKLLPDPVVADTGLNVVSKTETVGPITEKTDYQATATNPVLIRPYPAADRLISEFLLPAGRNDR